MPNGRIVVYITIVPEGVEDKDKLGMVASILIKNIQIEQISLKKHEVILRS